MNERLENLNKERFSKNETNLPLKNKAMSNVKWPENLARNLKSV